MENIFNLATSFVSYFRNFNTKHIPENFIKEYYVLSHQQFISVTEFTKWLSINRKTIIENLQKNYKIDEDYFMITQDEEKLCVILYKDIGFKPNQKFIKITSKCFKDICVRSNSNKGILMRKYYMELDDLFKKFHLDKIKDISEENDILLNNQSKNKLKKEEGLYLWTDKINSLEFRVGHATNVYERINIHNSSNKDKIYPIIIIYSKCFVELEYIFKIALKKYSYRGEFYKCSRKELNLVIKDIIKFLNKYNKNCNIKQENIIKFLYRKNSIVNKKLNSKKKSKKENSKKI